MNAKEHISTVEKARLLIQAVDGALKKGVKHFALDGTPLLTTKAVLEALQRDGEIRLQDPDPVLKAD